jgi:hypothetical protein
MWVTVQAAAPAAGSSVVSTSPFPSVATHRDEGPHESVVSGCGIVLLDQVWTPLAGVLETNMVVPEVAMHSDAEGQEIAVSPVVLLISLAVQADDPARGLVDVRTLPALSIAAHSNMLGHEMPTSGACDWFVVTSLSIGVIDQLDVPPAGLVEVTALPALSTATHIWLDGHDMPAMMLLGSIRAACHPDPCTGLVEVSTFVSPSTAAHRVADGHDTAPARDRPEVAPSGSTGCTVHDAGSSGRVEVRVFPAQSTATHQVDGHEIPTGPLAPSICSTFQV